MAAAERPKKRDTKAGQHSPRTTHTGEGSPSRKRDGGREPDRARSRRDSDQPAKERKPRRSEGRGRLDAAGKRPNRDAASKRSTRPPQDASRRISGPEIPDEVTPRDLDPGARNQLKTLTKENADEVARHLAMAARLIDHDPALAHEHALAASRRAGRIAVVRESVAITAYATGDFALALRELRTYRRLSGRDDQIALMVDSERGLGRPDRALELGRSVDRSALPVETRVALAIAMSGARLDRGELELALGELEIPELDPDRAFEWSPALFTARATVLEDLGRSDEAAFWTQRAAVAASAVGVDDDELVVEDGLADAEEG